MQPGRCKFYNGSHHNECCEAGVRYVDITPEPFRSGAHWRRPCIRDHGNLEGRSPAVLADIELKGTCSKYQEPTPAEIAEHDAEGERAILEALGRATLLEPLLRELKAESRKAKADVDRTEKCPVCKKGEVRIRIAGTNQHAAVYCSTENCVSFME